jgi:UDP-glucose:(heptosyl)LPS alpha-1,3-glucosyltransferase
MIRILQIAPEIGPGTGVGGVAHQLETQWRAAGIPTSRFTLQEARGSWLPAPGPGLRGKAALWARVTWFSTVGTMLARRAVRRDPGALVVCHNDALVGDVYVNHGVLVEAMRLRGHPFWRIVRNPVHPFTIVRDTVRYRSRRVHRAVVSLTAADADALRRSFGRVRPRSVVIGNGVDPERFRPPTQAQRHAARARLGVGLAEQVVLFVGHEFGRKGLPELVEAFAALGASTHLVVVGGTPDLLRDIARHPSARAVGDRLHLLGPLSDPRWVFQGADLFALPSAYEAYPLVVLEALASGLPVVATPVGSVPDLIVDGLNGHIVERNPASIRAGIARVLAADPQTLRAAARATALEHTWDAVAERYLVLLNDLSGSAALPMSPRGVEDRHD